MHNTNGSVGHVHGSNGYLDKKTLKTTLKYGALTVLLSLIERILCDALQIEREGGEEREGEGGGGGRKAIPRVIRDILENECFFDEVLYFFVFCFYFV